MGELVGVSFGPHTPRIHAPQFRELAPWRGMVDALGGLGEELRGQRLDALVAVSVHWISTFPIYVSTAARHTGRLTAPECPDLISDVDYDLAGAPALAEAVVAEGVGAGIPVVGFDIPSYLLDYGTVVPVRHLYPPAGAAAPPLVSTSVCLKSDPDECRRWGAAITRAVRASDLRVGLLISGSFSHRLVREPAAWPLPEHRALDERLCAQLVAGDLAGFESLLAETRRQVEVEMDGRHLYTAIGAIREAARRFRGRSYGYGPSSGSGNPVLSLS